MMNFVNLAHCSFAMVALCHGDAGQPLRLPFLPLCRWRSSPARSFPCSWKETLFKRLYRASDLDQCLLTIGIVSSRSPAFAWFFTSGPAVGAAAGMAARSKSVSRHHLRRLSPVPDRVRPGHHVAAVLFHRETRFGGRSAPRWTTSEWRAAWASTSTAPSCSRSRSAAGSPAWAARWAIEVVGLDPNFALAYLVYVLIVVAVGGLGSIGGSFAAAVVLGISDMAGKYYFPWLGAFLIYLVMVALLMWRPLGLFGKR